MSRVVLTPAAQHCRDLIRKSDPDRLLLAELAPAPRRPALWALAAFNWEVARIPERVSEPMLGDIRRQWWRDTWKEIAAGAPRRHPVAEALAEVHAATPFDPALIETFLDAREAEHDGPPADLPALVCRAEQTGGILARLEATALGVASDTAAEHTGTAWALIGSLRALPQSLSRGRHQLPEALLSEYEVHLDRLDPAQPPSGFVTMVASIAAAAEPALKGQSRLPPLFRGYHRLTCLYRNRLRRAGWNPYDARINAATAGRALRVLQVRLGL